jgi:hypothetical protein
LVTLQILAQTTIQKWKKLMTDEERKEIDDAVKAYLKNGGTVTVCEPGARTEDLQVGQWGRKKPAPKSKKSKETETEEQV